MVDGKNYINISVFEINEADKTIDLLSTEEKNDNETIIRTRVWERGSGITMACGTGACATAVAAVLTGRAGRKSQIAMDGGNLTIEWRESDNHVYMTGPAAFIFDGEIDISHSE